MTSGDMAVKKWCCFLAECSAESHRCKTLMVVAHVVRRQRHKGDRKIKAKMKVI